MINKINYGTPEDLELKSVKKKLELKKLETPIEKDPATTSQPTTLVAPKYDLGTAPLAPDATEPNTKEIDRQILLNKPAFKPSNYGQKTISEVVGEVEDESKVDGVATKDKAEAESSDYMGAGLKTLDFAVDAAKKSKAMGRKERNAQTMSMVSKGASTGAALGSVIPGVGTLIGGAAGAVGGLATGLIKSGKSKKLEDKRLQEERDKKINDQIKSREDAQRLSDAQKSSEKSKAILQGQQNILRSKY